MHKASSSNKIQIRGQNRWSCEVCVFFISVIVDSLSCHWPFHLHDLNLNSPLCLLFISHDCNSENLIFNQIVSFGDILWTSHHLPDWYCVHFLRRNYLLIMHESERVNIFTINLLLANVEDNLVVMQIFFQSETKRC